MVFSISCDHKRGGRANLGGEKARKWCNYSPKSLENREDTPGQVRTYNSAGDTDNN
jgi:hypothetical protein